MYLIQDFVKMLFFSFSSLIEMCNTNAQLGIQDWDFVCPIIPITIMNKLKLCHSFQYWIYVEIYQITLADGCRKVNNLVADGRERRILPKFGFGLRCALRLCVLLS